MPLCRQTGPHPHAKSCCCEITLNLHFGSASPPCTSSAQSSWLDVPSAVVTTLLLESYWRNVCQGPRERKPRNNVDSEDAAASLFNMLQPCKVRPVHLLGQCWQETGEYLHQADSGEQETQSRQLYLQGIKKLVAYQYSQYTNLSSCHIYWNLSTSIYICIIYIKRQYSWPGALQ